LKVTFDNYKERLDDLHQFIDFVINYDNLEKLLSDVMLSEKFSHDQDAVDNAVVLSTIHQAKGLEWKYVFIVGLRDGDFPHHKSLEDVKQLEEERRLFYVAATRARDELTMLYPVRKMTYQYGEMTGGPSMFIRELDDSLYTVARTGQYFQLDDEQKHDDGEEIIYLDF
jgi:DNA helicase-2/ATP-dependent DNA helicase PcrA